MRLVVLQRNWQAEGVNGGPLLSLSLSIEKEKGKEIHGLFNPMHTV